jgi:hypothetical protein
MAEALAEVGATVILNGRDANTLKAAEGEGAAHGKASLALVAIRRGAN